MTPSLEQLIFVGGLLHFATLLGSAQVPKELKFKEELPKLAPLFQHWIWTAGGYILLNIVAFAIASTFFSNDLVDGSRLARLMCGYIAIFWGIRLVIQLFIFDAKPYLRNRFLTVGYHGLTLVFIYQTLVYGYAAFAM
jgi:ABC-type amino acid transport system permease subunit